MTDQPTHVYAVLFACTPSAGSEAGVGWQFANALTRYGSDRGVSVTLVTSSPHSRAVKVALQRAHLDNLQQVRIAAVPVPRFLLESRSGWIQRATYLVWQFVAVGWVAADQNRIRASSVRTQRHLVHHLTYATEAIPTFEGLIRSRSAWVFGPAGSAARPSGKRRTDTAYKIRHLLRRMLMKPNLKADVLVATNASTARLWARISRSPQKVFLEPNIMLDPLEMPAVVDWADRRYDVAIIGLLTPRKQVDTALRAASRAGRNISVVVVGDGPEAARLKQLALELTTVQVTFTGRLSREDTLIVLSNARVLAHASLQEGSPWVVGEAQTLEVTPVVFPLGGSDTVVSAGGTGRLARSHTVDAFADAIRLALEEGQPDHVSRWSTDRMVTTLSDWYSTAVNLAAQRMTRR